MSGEEKYICIWKEGKVVARVFKNKIQYKKDEMNEWLQKMIEEAKNDIWLK